MSMLLNINIGGRTVPVVVRRRKNMRHLRMQLDFNNQVVVSVPWYCSDREALGFIDKQQLWLEQQLAFAPQAYGISDWLKKHPYLSASGERFFVRVEAEDCVRAHYLFESDGKEAVLCVPQSGGNLKDNLLSLVKLFAKDALACRLFYHAKRLGLEVKRLTVRDQRSRWGSCSIKKSISLNWRLVLIGPALQDYVILHELAHLTEMNHSSRFWALLHQYDPNYKTHELDLKKVSNSIMRVGR